MSEGKTVYEELPGKFVEMYTSLLGSKADKFFQALVQPRKASIRANTLKTSPSWIEERLHSYGWKLDKFDWLDYAFYVETDSPGATLEHIAGYYYVQSDSSMVPGYVLDPRPGELVLDIAASPGSKTTHLVQLMKNQGGILANDVSIGRISILYNNLKRFGALNTIVRKSDGRQMSGREIFDKALADVPCSSESSIARLRTSRTWSPEDKFSSLQRQLLSSAVRLTKIGGKIVYSTCTFRPGENEAVIDWALENLPVKLVGVKLMMDHDHGLGGYECSKKVVRIWPWQGEGFFVAKLERI